MQFDILVPNYYERGNFFKNETDFNLNYYRKYLKLKNYFLNSFKSCKISTFYCCFLSSVILHRLSTTACSEEHNFGLIRDA